MPARRAEIVRAWVRWPMYSTLQTVTQTLQDSAEDSRAAPVVRVKLHEVKVPLSSVARRAMAESDNRLGMAIAAEEPWVEADFLFCCLADEAGVEGWAESYL